MGVVRNELTIEHFEAWFDGQIAFGINKTKPTWFYDFYLAQHPTLNPNDRLRQMVETLPRDITALELKIALEQWSAAF